MKRLIGICVVAALIAGTAQAAPTYLVDLGSVEPYPMADWGPVQPTTSGGNWGGMGSGTAPGSVDQLCRTVWGHTGDLNWASITFPKPVVSVTIRHLLGLADDSFDVNVFGGGQLWGSIVDAPSQTELWTSTTLSGPPGATVTLTVTGSQWSGFSTYGQVGIDWITATPIPAPGAILLGGIGVGLVGWLRRLRTL